ncbi:MAG: transcription-repair coupling factor [Bacteroidota bacterium]
MEQEYWNTERLLEEYAQWERVRGGVLFLNESPQDQTKAGWVQAQGLAASARWWIAAAAHRAGLQGLQVVILPDREEALYACSDLESLLGASVVSLFPGSYKRKFGEGEQDPYLVLQRAGVLGQMSLRTNETPHWLVTWPEALMEEVVMNTTLARNTLEINKNESVNLDFLIELMSEMGFERVDFVYEPGQYAIRGGILDVYSYASDWPYRLELYGDCAERLRTFDPESQLTVHEVDKAVILPNLQADLLQQGQQSLITYFPSRSVLWHGDWAMLRAASEGCWNKASSEAQAFLTSPEEWFGLLLGFKRVHLQKEGGQEEWAKRARSQGPVFEWVFRTEEQPMMRKQFDKLVATGRELYDQGYRLFLCGDNTKQMDRLDQILEDLQAGFRMIPLTIGLHAGFTDNERAIVYWTEHQLFERFHKYKVRGRTSASEKLTLKEILDFKPGDYVVHMDHGVGKYAGMEKIQVNGQWQETIRISYRDDDLLYVSIHSLHKVSRYSGKDGTPPKIHKLGSDTWDKLKTKTKAQVKDIAKDLIELYARRKASQGHAFPPDNYLQHELEASFLYEDTPDQSKATEAVKADMQKAYPMDRLVCGDVGFGKTEVAIRAAFKAACDGKQTAVLVPTTILALQHARTFASRLQGLPVRVDYLNRFRSATEVKSVLEDLEAGRIDILIGTHKIVGSKIKFKDLGLLIIDEEQKFGVATKEKLKAMKVSVDTLTLTATPIPRTMQFSLLGARDLSVISTPPPNRQPIHTELMVIDEDKVREAILYETDRGGQVFFVHNRVQGIEGVADLIGQWCPGLRIGVAHGQMPGDLMEKILLQFIEGKLDILVATNIIESGLDIPNANTILINQAQNFGLSDLHQMRGRVGRSNLKAFCYLIVPPLFSLTQEARRRLQAIEQHSELGSGFQIALRDLDIRGAGNMLGAEQSGFITEIGLELFQKILDEAIRELRTTDYADLYADQPMEPPKTDVLLDTDAPALLPDFYVRNTTERLSLYRELDDLESEEALEAFETRLMDRFGPLPEQASLLLILMRLRLLGGSLGMEKMVWRKDLFKAHLPDGSRQDYYQGPVFGALLQAVQENPSAWLLRQQGATVQLVYQHKVNAHSLYTMLQQLAQEALVTKA